MAHFTIFVAISTINLELSKVSHTNIIIVNFSIIIVSCTTTSIIIKLSHKNCKELYRVVTRAKY